MNNNMLKRKTRQKNSTYVFFVLFTIILLFIIIIFKGYNKKYILLILSPLVYVFVYLMFAKIYLYWNNPGMFVLNCVSFIRYYFLPILIIANNNYLTISMFRIEGIILFIYEEICIGFFLTILSQKIYSKNISVKTVYNSNKIGIILKALVLLGVIILFSNPNILDQYNFFWVSADNAEIVKSRSIITGLNAIIFDWAKLVFPLMLATFFIKKYKKNSKWIYYFFTILVVLFFNLMVFSGTSRNSAIIPGIASMFFILKIFPEKRKYTFIILSVCIFIVIIRLTIFKTEYIGTDNFSTMDGFIEYIENYFAGPKQMSISISAYKIYKSLFTFETFITDIFGNFPGLSQFFNLENRTATLFNLAYYSGGNNRDAIIPMVGSGLFYFGYIFSILPEMVIILFMALTDNFYRNSNTIGELYFSAYFGVRFGYYYYLSISTVFSFIYTMVIPIIILVYLDNKIKVK